VLLGLDINVVMKHGKTHQQERIHH